MNEIEVFLKRLEKRFGNIDRNETAIAKFGASYSDGIKGWQFSEEAIIRANAMGHLLTMDLDIPSPCDLDCNYCFAKEEAYYRPQKGDHPLSMERIMECLLEAKSLGLQSVKIVGFGEPFRNPRLFNLIEWCSGQGIWLVIFTAGYTLGEVAFGGSEERVLDFLYNSKVSLMVKYHTLDRGKEKIIVRKPWYPKKRDRILSLLLDHGGFNKQTPTRLGLENVIASQNTTELAAIYKYFKIYRNIHCDIDPPIPVGRTATAAACEQIGLGRDQLVELYRLIHGINKDNGIPYQGISPFIGNPPCSQLANSLYLTLSGKIMSCCGGSEEYCDLNKSGSITKAHEMNPYRKDPQAHHDCPYRNAASILPYKLIEELDRELRY